MTNRHDQHATDRAMLDLAARAAIRAHGLAEPNPLVGCVLATASGNVVAIAHHRRFGGAHAEVEAILAARTKGADTKGLIAYVTLEPCNHQGKTPPCTRALIDAGVGEVVIARLDPNPVASGGADALRAAGVRVRFTDASERAIRLTDPFAKRIATNLPWVIAKWAQSIDGRIATRTGDSKWISSERSRALVHRWRSRVDVILTGVGTVLADDPLLTARTARTPRRVALRAVVDPSLRTPLTSQLARTARETPLVLFCAEHHARSARADAIRASGAQVVPVPAHPSDPAISVSVRLDLAFALRWLATERDATNVLVEAGPGLVGSLAKHRLLDELRVFVAPMLIGDGAALQPASIGQLDRIATAARYIPDTPRRVGRDALLVFRAARE
jgi:diaminohydroxyphosphoribosylaminopyrimidine deaminase/5-amino-6-(5-phosphoribosylamino)uracil reductase